MANCLSATKVADSLLSSWQSRTFVTRSLLRQAFTTEGESREKPKVKRSLSAYMPSACVGHIASELREGSVTDGVRLLEKSRFSTCLRPCGLWASLRYLVQMDR